MLPSTEWKRTRLQEAASSRSGTPARRSRSASARATTASRRCSSRRRWRRVANGGAALHAAPGASAVENVRARAHRAPLAVADAGARSTGSRSTSPSSSNALVGVTQEGTSAARRSSTRRTSRRQDRHRAGDRRSRQNEKYNAAQIDERHPRPRAVHRLRAADEPRIALAHGRRERRLRRRRRGADRAPRVRLLLAGQVPERGGHRRDAARPVDGADRRAAPDRRRAAAGRDGRRRGDGARRPGSPPRPCRAAAGLVRAPPRTGRRAGRATRSRSRREPR